MEPSHSYYGSREIGAARLSVLLAKATGLKFVPRHSFYIGDYYSAGKPGGDSIDVRPNEIEDEDGKFLQWKEFAGYQTIVEIEEASEGFFEELRPKLAEVKGLQYLRSVKLAGVGAQAQGMAVSSSEDGAGWLSDLGTDRRLALAELEEPPQAAS